MPRNASPTLASFLFVGLVICTVAWHTKFSVISPASEGQRLLPPPAKTRATDRQPKSASHGNPHQSFIARCTVGLTDQEIGWIIGDFENAGLDRDYPADMTETSYLALRQAQDRWYFELLLESLQWSPDQIRQATKHLTDNYEREKNIYQNKIKEIKPVEIDGKLYVISGADIINSIFWTSQWNSQAREALLPWNLCSLTPQQESIVRKVSPASQSEEIEPGSESRLTKNGEREFAIPKFGDVDAVLPFSADTLSKLDGLGSTPNLLSALHYLHPAQLKLLLLFDPNMSAQIRRALDSTSSASPAE